MEASCVRKHLQSLFSEVQLEDQRQDFSCTGTMDDDVVWEDHCDDGFGQHGS
jgi:hypothetical protein